jgi:hypothetical protein
MGLGGSPKGSHGVSVRGFPRAKRKGVPVGKQAVQWGVPGRRVRWCSQGGSPQKVGFPMGIHRVGPQCSPGENQAGHQGSRKGVNMCYAKGFNQGGSNMGPPRRVPKGGSARGVPQGGQTKGFP